MQYGNTSLNQKKHTRTWEKIADWIEVNKTKGATKPIVIFFSQERNALFWTITVTSNERKA